MKAIDLRKLIGKEIKFKSNKTRQWLNQIEIGIVKEVVRREVYINGDWHEIKNFVVLSVNEE